MELGKDSEKRPGDEEMFGEIVRNIGALHIDNSYEWLNRLEKSTEGDPDLRLRYLEWTRTQKPKQQIHVELPHIWLHEVAKADFRKQRVAIDFRMSLFSKEVDYLEIALDEVLGEVFVVLPDPGALTIYGYPVVELPKTSIADEDLQMHPAFLSLSILGDPSTDPEVRIPKLVLPVGRLVRTCFDSVIWSSYFREADFTTKEDTFEMRRRGFWKYLKGSKAMTDTDYFVVIDVVTPGYPVWIIYNPDREEDSEDPTAADLIQSTSKFPQLDSKSGFGAAQILNGIKNWTVLYFWIHDLLGNVRVAGKPRFSRNVRVFWKIQEYISTRSKPTFHELEFRIQ